MVRLPKIKWVKSHAANKLPFWLAVRAADVDSRDFRISGVSPHEPSGGDTPASVDSDPVCDYDASVDVGDIRLLSPMMCPTADRPVYIAVFRSWDPDEFLIAPYSPYSIAATSSELEFPMRCSPLRVLCPWNTLSVHPSSISCSWLIDKLTCDEMADIWHSFRHSAAGHPIPESLSNRVGCPIRRPDDPRIAYQCEESYVLQAIADMERLRVAQME